MPTNTPLWKSDGTNIALPNGSGQLFTYDVTPTIQAISYAAGKTVGATLTMASLLGASLAARLRGLTVLDNSHTDGAYDFFMSSTNPAFADNASFNWTTTGFVQVASIDVSDWKSGNAGAAAAGTNSDIAALRNLDVPILCATNNLYITMVARLTNTLVVGGIELIFQFENYG